MKRLLATSAIFGLAIAALALGSFVGVAQDTYKFKANSPAATAKCMLCHTSKMGGGKLNAYGMEVKTALKGSMKLTSGTLHSLDHMKTGKNTKTNGELLKAGQLPS